MPPHTACLDILMGGPDCLCNNGQKKAFVLTLKIKVTWKTVSYIGEFQAILGPMYVPMTWSIGRWGRMNFFETEIVVIYHPPFPTF